MESTKPSLDILLVDDEADFRHAVVRLFTREGHRMSEASDATTALERLSQRHFDVVIVDLFMPGPSGLDLLGKVKAQDFDGEVIILTGSGSIETAVEAMRRGAFDYLTKPTSLDALLVAVKKAAEHAKLRSENRALRSALQRTGSDVRIIGESPAVKDLLRLIERAGPSGKPILIQGETGTGKELVARALHRASPVADKPLITINCAALPETLLESELFGYEKGAFTGAVSAKPGLFEMADGGTLFIDEMGEMPGALQAKLLRVLEDGSLRRIGSVKERRVNVRLLAATNRNLEQEVKSGHFREDLFYRINVLCLEVPPLRNRPGDIRLLTEHFLGPKWSIDPEAMAALERYSWPGNVRQLINAIERAKIMADEREVFLEDFPAEIQNSGTPVANLETGDDLALLQRAKIVEVLVAEKGNKARAARRLGISRRSLYRALERFDIK
ncbi:MAG: hypothetical protein RIS70_3883 [Planctomycetota bacterium]